MGWDAQQIQHLWVDAAAARRWLRMWGTDRHPEDNWSTYDALRVLTCGALQTVLGLPPDLASYLTVLLQPDLQRVSDRLDSTTDDPGQRLQFHIILADQVYFSWSGQRQFISLRTLEPLAQLPETPILRTQLDMLAQYFRILQNAQTRCRSTPP